MAAPDVPAALIGDCLGCFRRYTWTDMDWHEAHCPDCQLPLWPADREVPRLAADRPPVSWLALVFAAYQPQETRT